MVSRIKWDASPQFRTRHFSHDLRLVVGAKALAKLWTSKEYCRRAPSIWPRCRQFMGTKAGDRYRFRFAKRLIIRSWAVPWDLRIANQRVTFGAMPGRSVASRAVCPTRAVKTHLTDPTRRWWWNCWCHPRCRLAAADPTADNLWRPIRGELLRPHRGARWLFREWSENPLRGNCRFLFFRV